MTLEDGSALRVPAQGEGRVTMHSADRASVSMDWTTEYPDDRP